VSLRTISILVGDYFFANAPRLAMTLVKTYAWLSFFVRLVWTFVDSLLMVYDRSDFDWLAGMVISPN
jgi:hypothetical protein